MQAIDMLLRKVFVDCHEGDGPRDRNVETDVDFGSVGLYIIALQVIVAVVSTAIVCMLCTWATAASGFSAVRTIALASATGAALVRSPLRIGRVHGAALVFVAARPAVLVYTAALVLEQLLHACAPEHPTTRLAHEPIYSFVHNSASALMVLSGFIRARHPQAESDLSFAFTGMCLVVLAMLPPRVDPGSGPLCVPATLFEAGERVVRAALFAVLYTVHAYASVPRHRRANEVVICVVRATMASCWALVATAWALIAVPVQVLLTITYRMRYSYASVLDDQDDPVAFAEDTALAGATTPVDMSDMEYGVLQSEVESIMAAYPPDRVEDVATRSGFRFDLAKEPFSRRGRVCKVISQESVAAVLARECAPANAGGPM